MLSREVTLWLDAILDVFLLLVLVAVVLLMVTGVVLWIQDRFFQKTHAIRRNYPLIGRFRYFFEHLGEFFRQYFFAMDREELPFNRAQRAWVYRAAKDLSTMVPFGSTKSMLAPGRVIFLNDPYPMLDKDKAETIPMMIGPHARQPYVARSLHNISAMSYGALSKPAVLALSKGASRAGCWLNTGEGGLSPWHLEGGCDIVFQIGTARYGVRDADGLLSDEHLRAMAAHQQVKMFEIKLSQGAKPGKGGILPGAKVTAEIAAIRNIPVGEASISPNRHPDVSSASELLDMIHRVREVTGKPVGIKMVVGSWAWLEDFFMEILRRGIESAPDYISIDSGDGGTGAAPMSLMDDVGLHLAESLPLVVDLLEGYGLRERIRVVAAGKLITPNMVAWALALGADFCVSARGYMFALGCIQAMQCDKNTCPTGITTHNKRLQRGLVPIEKAERVYQYHRHLVKEVEVIAHSCGVLEPRGLRRHHARMVTGGPRSVLLSELWPPVEKGIYAREERRSTGEPFARLKM
ncbi:MAG: FMN-binding glutamate synthase family protein [Gammaproteobacteria bacterium HGW-Gammaproteobacteria-14]|nr:MAG: FMN-binding glutamate synthase family protein [Gammaproteobacteria bacterium HGW-Gammaproteobacteria-14]